jgi:hypothetical protein
MAHPFSRPPTLADYMVWARDTHGFVATCGFATTKNGRAVPTVRIGKDGGPFVVIPGMKQTEFLTATIIGSLDRRLGVTSPWFSVHE